ncbi:DUF488 family protein [Niabella sp. W65]|nr:DUF488 family protein [Niabella sp. W65]MCH7364743.1 DUF488 family protein [Niabella sp. W65]
MKSKIHIKRVYDKPLKNGCRVLVDRLWPRGVKKEEAALDEWIKDLAPSPSLRKWWAHDPVLWNEFQKRYEAELVSNKAVEAFIQEHNDKPVITLVYGARDKEHNHALVLQNYLRGI